MKRGKMKKSEYKLTIEAESFRHIHRITTEQKERIILFLSATKDRNSRWGIKEK